MAGQSVIDVLSPFPPDEPVLVDSPAPSDWGCEALLPLGDAQPGIERLAACLQNYVNMVGITVREDGFPI